MTPADIQLIQSNFALVAPVAPQAAAMFYDRVFEREPGAVAMFRGDMVVQGQRLMAMIGAAVNGLHDLPALDRTLAELGRRHVGYGVQAPHYDLVGGALLDTLAAALGSEFTPAHRAAWAAFYGHIARTMLAASATQAAPAAAA
ncbi:MAG: hemin receptor [Burkholderiaceae bacterium]|nr:hemin receptor [Burkholderiaceae bacterium]